MLSQYLHSILDTLSAHPYISLFIGLLFAGEAVLIPAIYFTLSGKLHLSYVVLVALISTVLADSFWYYIGANIHSDLAKNVLSDRTQENLKKLSRTFSRRGEVILYCSKFVYGTRTAVQILAGLKPMPFSKYFAINFLGIASLILFIIALAYSVDATVENIQGIFENVKITFLVFVIILCSIYFILHNYFRKIWSQ